LTSGRFESAIIKGTTMKDAITTAWIKRDIGRVKYFLVGLRFSPDMIKDSPNMLGLHYEDSIVFPNYLI
jgi:hypothetical protein